MGVGALENKRRYLKTIRDQKATIATDRKRIKELEKERDDLEGLIYINEKLNLRILKLKEIFELLAKSSQSIQGVGSLSLMASIHSLAQRGLTLIARQVLTQERNER